MHAGNDTEYQQQDTIVFQKILNKIAYRFLEF